MKISIPKEVVSQMPQVTFAGKIITVTTAREARKALAFLRDQKVVGFDTETRPNFRKGQNHKVSLIQISTDRQAFLFRICDTGLMDEMREFMECEDVTKIGLSLKDDIMNLHKLCDFTPRGFVELQDYVREFGIADASLQKIYAILFGRRISKGQRLTNWEATELTEPQKNYAAIDAWACLRIHSHLNSGKFLPESSPYIVYEDEEG